MRLFLFSSLWRANVPEWLPSPRLNLSFDDNHLKWSLSATQKGTWLALGILIGLSLVWPIYSYFFPCVFRSAQIGEKQEKILLLILCILLFSLVPSWPIRIILMLLVYSASYLRNDSFEFHSLQKIQLDSRCQLGK